MKHNLKVSQIKQNTKYIYIYIHYTVTHRIARNSETIQYITVEPTCSQTSYKLDSVTGEW